MTSWFMSTRTTLPCAPHSALICSAVPARVSLSIKACYRDSPRLSRSSPAFLAAVFSTKPVTLAPAARSLYQTCPPRKKDAPFPKRAPAHAGFSRRSASPATSDISSSPSCSSGSRASSCGSHRRLSSSLSSSRLFTIPEAASAEEYNLCSPQSPFRS